MLCRGEKVRNQEKTNRHTEQEGLRNGRTHTCTGFVGVTVWTQCRIGAIDDGSGKGREYIVCLIDIKIIFLSLFIIIISFMSKFQLAVSISLMLSSRRGCHRHFKNIRIQSKNLLSFLLCQHCYNSTKQ